MTFQIRPPLHDWHRHYPTARAIAGALQDHAEVLCLPTWRLMLDIRARFGCSESTARMAVAFARRGGQGRAAA